jgi:hypothetical protein
MRELLSNNEAFSGPVLKLLLIVAFILVIVSIGAFISLLWGLFSFIGLCLLVGAAFVLIIEKGKVTIAVNSVFTWLLILGIVCAVLSPFLGSITGNPTIDFSVIPGAKAFSMNLL